MCPEEACERCVDGRFGERSDVRLEARPLARFHDAVVVGRSEFTGEQKEGLVLQVGELDGMRVREAVTSAELRGEGLERRTSVQMPVIGSGCRASPMSSSPARTRRDSALNSSLAMTVMFGLSFSTAARIVPRVSKLAGGG